MKSIYLKWMKVDCKSFIFIVLYFADRFVLISSFCFENIVLLY